jgi:hypothetical protein
MVTSAQRRRARHRPAPLQLSAADRRAIRQRCALAAELKLHSVSVLGSVWTLHHPRERHTQPRPESARQGTGTGATSQPSRSTQRSRARAAAHAALMQKAQAFRARSVLTSWSRAAGFERLAMQLSTSQLASQSLLPPPPPPPPSMPPPLPPPQPSERQSPPSPQQSTEGVRAPNKRAPSTPTAGDSPVGPRTKTRVVPLPPPPPSIPPSPPSPTPPSPPSTPATPAAEPPRAMRSLQLADEPPPPSISPSPPSPQGSRHLPEPSGSNQSEAGACSHALVGLVACTGGSSLVAVQSRNTSVDQARNVTRCCSECGDRVRELFSSRETRGVCRRCSERAEDEGEDIAPIVDIERLLCRCGKCGRMYPWLAHSHAHGDGYVTRCAYCLP